MNKMPGKFLVNFLRGAGALVLAGLLFCLPAAAQPPFPGDPTVPLGGAGLAALGAAAVTFVILVRNRKF
jgi:hypothetical protein